MKCRTTNFSPPSKCEAAKAVILVHTNEGWRVSYAASLQSAFRITFKSPLEAIVHVHWWNVERDEFKLSIVDWVDHRYDVNEERKKLGLGPYLAIDEP